MAEKILNTRILNKIDTLENWNASTLPIKKGEICIATVAAAEGTGLTEPVVMIKIGEDGVKTFKDLPWNLYAKASDVVAAAKSEATLKAFINTVIGEAGIATDEALSTLAGRVTTAEGNITSLKGLVGDEAVATQITNAINNLDLANTYAAKSHTHAMTEVTGLGDAIADAKKAGTDAAAALETYKAANDPKVKANADAIDAIKDGTTIDSFADVETALAGKQAVGDYATKTEAQGYADAKDTAIAAAKKAGDDAQADVDALEAKVGTVPADKTVVEMISDAQTAATYNDTQVKADIKANADDITALKELVGENPVSTQISTAVTNAKTELKGSDTDTAASVTIAGAKKYADSLDAAMDARVDALESAVGEGGSVAEKITAEIQKLDKEDTAVTGQYVSAVSETDGVITVERAALPDYTNTYAAKVHTHTIADVTDLQDALDAKAAASDVTAINGRVTTAEGKLTTLIGSDADKSVRTIANEELAAQLIPETAKESLNTLQEIAAWIQAHPDDASAMNTRISDLETLVGDDPVATQINTAIEALKIGDYAKAADLTAAVGRITTLEGASHTHDNKDLLDTYTQTEADLADAVAKKHEHANATELAKFVDGDKDKLDSAVQSVTAGTGLTATKTGTDVAIGFDDTTTFVFDCGNSAE